MEYALLGSIEGADTKRINTRVYLANVYARQFDAAILWATSHQNQDVPAAANVDTFGFCFIEKTASMRSPESPPGHQPDARS